MHEHAWRAPHPALASHVGPYTGFAERYPAPLRRLEVPFGGVPMIVSFGLPHRMVGPRGACSRTSFIAGVHDGPTTVEHDGEAAGIQVNFTPLGARRFLGVPGAELTNLVVELDDVLGPAARELSARLAEAPDWDARFALLDAAILRRIDASRPVSPDVDFAWRRLEASAGAAPVGAIAQALGCSRRHLSKRFGEEVGLAPKAFARVLRFSRAATLLREGGIDSCADVAYTCGYYDQPHFNRDFRELASTTPGDYVARLLPDGFGVAA